MKLQHKYILLFLLLCITTHLYADAGAPLLLLINVQLFTLGQIWIILSEFLYLIFVLNTIFKKTIFGWVLLFNIISTLIGAFLFPLLLGLFGMLGFIKPLEDKPYGKIIPAFFTWIMGDKSPYLSLAVSMTIIYFIISYFITVWIEYTIICRLINRKEIDKPLNLLMHVFIFNAISYLGLILLFFCMKLQPF